MYLSAYIYYLKEVSVHFHFSIQKPLHYIFSLFQKLCIYRFVFPWHFRKFSNVFIQSTVLVISFDPQISREWLADSMLFCLLLEMRKSVHHCDRIQPRILQTMLPPCVTKQIMVLWAVHKITGGNKTATFK